MTVREWLAAGPSSPDRVDVAVLGAPISKASISPSQAWSTPAAFREALGRFSTWDADHDVDVAALSALDLGDVASDRDDPDAAAAHTRIEVAAAGAGADAGTVVVVGGDNSLTRPAMHGVMAARPRETWGLITLDAHHDCRPLDHGPRNGTPVRELIEAGLPGELVAQLGISAFGNAREQARWAIDRGVRVYSRARVLDDGIGPALTQAIAALKRSGVTALYVDIDVDVVDRAFAPACPASLPGGLSPGELLQAAHIVGREPRVFAVDFTEVDANADLNGVTVRLAAASFVTLCSGIAMRRGGGHRA